MVGTVIIEGTVETVPSDNHCYSPYTDASLRFVQCQEDSFRIDFPFDKTILRILPNM